jgi:cell wall-associated NlpC family hydrolase
VRRASVTLALIALLGAGCGRQQRSVAAPRATVPAAGATVAPAPAIPAAHPQAVEPVAGAAPAAAAQPSAPAEVSVGPAESALAEPVSDATVRQELAASGLPADPTRATLTPSGLAIPPINAPAAVQALITAGNEIARLPYRYGGGHLTYEDTAYDCSGSISFVFAAAHLLSSPVVSGQLMRWGDPGPGRWVTVFANPRHTFMYVAGLRFDTVALAQTGTRWSNRPATEPDLKTFAVRHPPGL